MKELKLYSKDIVNAYLAGDSMDSIAKRYDTYATTIMRILKKEGVKSRYSDTKKGALYVKNGDKLIEWAKAQGRLVTKEELAKIVGTKRLSPSYFLKYPELGKYVVTHGRDDLKYYNDKLYDWLRENNIPFKPNDKTKLKKSVTALLVGEYSNIILNVAIKPIGVSKFDHETRLKTILDEATRLNLKIISLNKKDFEDLDNIKELLESLKYSKEK